MLEQEALLVTLVEVARNVPTEQRQPFLHIVVNGPDLLFHDGFPNAKQAEVITQDLDILARALLLDMSYNSSGNREYWITPKGYRYYAHLKTRDAAPVEQVEREVWRLVESAAFAEHYPLAHEKLLQAARALWESDTVADETTIGHLCREAMQAFATALIERFPPDEAPESDGDIAQIRAVLAHVKGRLGATEHQLLEALLTYWGAVTDLAQRQEHGAQREKESLRREDSRRLVFQTAVLFFELHASLEPLVGDR